MNTTKSNVRFTINFFEQTITGTKASFNKAGKGFGPEYEELTSKMAAHPGFALVVKEQKQKTTKAKKTYEGLDFTFMENYIATLANAEEVSKKYKEVKAMAKNTNIAVYPFTKKWFLETFKNFNMDAAKEAIYNHRIAMAEQKATTVIAALPQINEAA